MNELNSTNKQDSRPPPATETSLGQDALALAKHWLRGRRGWVLLGLAVAASGLWLGWPSLVAAGIAPLLLGVLPCVVMCALGLCVMRGGGQSCSKTDPETSKDTAQPDLSPKRQETD